MCIRDSYWISKNKEIENKAKKDNLQLIEINELIDEGVLSFFNGHGSPPAEYKGKGDYPYIRVKDIVSWGVYKDYTSSVPLDIYKSIKGRNKELEENDIFYVRRGSYRIGSVALATKHDLELSLIHI